MYVIFSAVINASVVTFVMDVFNVQGGHVLGSNAKQLIKTQL